MFSIHSVWVIPVKPPKSAFHQETDQSIPCDGQIRYTRKIYKEILFQAIMSHTDFCCDGLKKTWNIANGGSF